jgi:hypothetical protein
VLVVEHAAIGSCKLYRQSGRARLGELSLFANYNYATCKPRMRTRLLVLVVEAVVGAEKTTGGYRRFSSAQKTNRVGSGVL